MEKKYFGDICYISLSSKTELVSADEIVRIPLSVTEYKILSYFIDHADMPVYLDELARFIWGSHADEKDPNSLKSQISRVRSKLDKLYVGLRNCIDTNYGLNSYTLKTTRDNTLNATDSAPKGLTDLQHNDLQVRQATYSTLIDLGYSNLEIATALVKNDLKLYKGLDQVSGIAQENEGSATQWAEYLSSAPDSFQYILNASNQIVGNFSFLSISSDQETAFKEPLH